MTEELLIARKLVADALDLAVEKIDENASIDTLESWDSLAHMRIILALESHLERQLEPEALLDIFSVKDISNQVDLMRR